MYIMRIRVLSVWKQLCVMFIGDDWLFGLFGIINLFLV